MLDAHDDGRKEGWEGGRKEGMELGENRVLDMMKQGLSVAEIERRLVGR
jgi:predicted transposase YdaD